MLTGSIFVNFYFYFCGADILLAVVFILVAPDG
jgi:hypothetical protein